MGDDEGVGVRVGVVVGVRVGVGVSVCVGDGEIVAVAWTGVAGAWPAQPISTPKSSPMVNTWQVPTAGYQAVAVDTSVMPWASSQRSASIAALQPSAAAVTACR